MEFAELLRDSSGVISGLGILPLIVESRLESDIEAWVQEISFSSLGVWYRGSLGWLGFGRFQSCDFRAAGLGVDLRVLEDLNFRAGDLFQNPKPDPLSARP